MGDKNEIIAEREQEEIMQERKKEIVMSDGLKLMKFKRNLIKAAVIAVIVIIGVGIIWFQANRIKQMDARMEEIICEYELQLSQPAISEPVTPQISLEVLSTEIKDIGELATIEYLYTNAAKFEDSKQIKNWNVPLTKKSFIIKYDGVIKAGVDVNEITLEIDEVNKVLTISVPKAKVLSHETDTESVELLDEKNGLFNTVTVDDKIQLDKEVEKEMEERAIENGILEKAQVNAENIIFNLISATPGIEEYEIVFVVLEG